jgi:hypothetical protein
MKSKPTLDPSELERHYGLSEPTDISQVAEADLSRVSRPESLASKVKVLLAIGAIAASPLIVTKITEAFGNTETVPGNTPVHTQSHH